MNVKQAVGNGQTQCRGCKDKGIWNVQWTDFLFRIDGLEGCYCRKCVNEIQAKEQTRKYTNRVLNNFNWDNESMNG